MPDEQVAKIIDKQRCIAELRKIMQDHDQLKNLNSDDGYLERFLICVDYDIQNAFERLKMFYALLIEVPEWFTTLKPSDKKDIIYQDIRVLLPNHDKQGRPIYLVKAANMDPSSMGVAEDIAPVDDFFIETLFLYDSGIENGVCVIVDVANFPMKLLKWMTPHIISTVVKRVLTMPIKELQYHVINSSFFVNAAIKIIWPFLPQQLKEKVKFHFNNYDSLYEYIDKDMLPEEYGGTQIVDYQKGHSLIFEKDSEISTNFRANRTDFLDSIKSLNNNNDTKS